MTQTPQAVAPPASSPPAKVRRDLFNTDYLKSDLKGRSVRGGAIMVFSQGCRFVLQTGSTVVLARLLTPADFGLIAMVAAVTNFAILFKDLGLSDATIQKGGINHGQISTLFWINSGLGLFISVIIVSLAPVVAWFYDDPRLTPVTMVLGSTFVFGGLAVQHQAMLRRHMRFFAIGLVDIVSMSVGVAAAITAALLGAGYWSLIIMHMAIAIATTVGIWIACPWLPGLPRRAVGVKKMLAFGSNLTAFSIVNYFARNADNILIGKFIGAAALGFYSKAYGLLMLPIRQLRSPLVSVGLPGLSRLQDDAERFKNYYLKMVQLLAFTCIPMALLLAVHSDRVIVLVLGQQWEAAASIFRILAFAAVIQPLVSTYGMIMISSGHAHRYFKLGVMTSTVYVISFVLGLPWGATGVALSYTVANYVLLIPILLYAFSGTSISVRDFFRVTLLPAVAAIFAAAASRAVLSLCSGFAAWLALLTALSAAGVFYVAVYSVMAGGRTTLRDIIQYAQLLLSRDKVV